MPPISPELFNQWYEQFTVGGIPNGYNLGGNVRIGTAFQLTSANLLALQSTAVTIVQPPFITQQGNLVPPGGYALYPNRLFAQFQPAASSPVAYTIGNADNAIQIEYVGKAVSLVSLLVTGVVDQATRSIKTAGSVSPGPALNAAACANLGLEVKLVGTTPALTLGNGLLNLFLEYAILPLQ